jgi:thioredoxin 1
MKVGFNDIINGDKPVLVDFHATWCQPCKAMAPILQNVKTKMGEKITILKIDVDQNPSISGKYNITGVPTLILFKKGKIVWRKSGVMPAEEIIRLTNQ